MENRQLKDPGEHRTRKINWTVGCSNDNQRGNCLTTKLPRFGPITTLLSDCPLTSKWLGWHENGVLSTWSPVVFAVKPSNPPSAAAATKGRRRWCWDISRLYCLQQREAQSGRQTDILSPLLCRLGVRWKRLGVKWPAKVAPSQKSTHWLSCRLDRLARTCNQSQPCTHGENSLYSILIKLSSTLSLNTPKDGELVTPKATIF